ncbi:MAG: phospholipid/glycerol acyltransferase [Bacteroidota bacterium]|jgi:1-acyl-sn-glycerol-3-phosphate acyltransferase
MRWIKDIGILLFSLYGLLAFIVVFILAFVAYFIVFSFTSKVKAPYIAHRYVSRPLGKTVMMIFFIKVNIRNKHLIDANKTYVMVGNHQSLLDIPIFAYASSNVFRYLSKEEMTKIPIFGYVIKRLYLSVNRKSKEDRARSMDAMIKSIREGISVFICPEGTRNKSTDPLLDFKDGAFRLAVQAQVPLAVITLKNSGKMLSPFRLTSLRPGVITGAWSEPIETKGLTADDVPILKQRVRAQMLAVLKD